MVDAIDQGQAQGDVRHRRGNEPRRFERQLRPGRVRPSWIFLSCRNFFSVRPASSLTSCCPPRRAWKGRNLYQHRAAHSSGCTRSWSPWGAAARIGESSRMWRMASGATGGTSIRRRSMDEIASLRNADCSPASATTGSKGTSHSNGPVAADGVGEPSFNTKQFAFPDCKARLFPLSWSDPYGTARRRIRPAPEKRPAPSSTFTREPDLPYRVDGIRQDDAGHLGRSLRPSWRRSAASKQARTFACARATVRSACGHG